jgi:diguanylate cyclase (GGDEF)-like protein
MILPRRVTVPTRVILLDADAHHRRASAADLAAAGFDVVASVATGEEAEEQVGRTHPDVAVIDVGVIGGADSARGLRALNGNALAFVALADAAEAHRVAELVAAGARGYVVKGEQRELVAAVRSVAEGGGFLSPSVTRPVLDEVERLYEREKVRNDELEELVRQLQDLSVTDWLTGLKNHGYFFERLSNELDRSLRHRRPLSVVIADIDDFKMINDTRGHAAGDRVLQEVSAVMADTVRSADVVCRIGGEEFAMVLPETDSGGAQLVAERTREQVSGLAIPGVGKVTVSLGIASVPEHAVDRDELMEAADRALYLAKRDGKNRTRLAGDVVSITQAAPGHRNGRNQVVDLLLRVLRLRDPALATHAERTADTAIALGARVALTTSQLEHLRVAALLQDVGKIGVADTILYKPGPLTDEEWHKIREHPKKGFELVGGLIHPEASEALLANHERWDGAGYPRGLTGEEIPLLARVLLVADAFVAMTTDRPFRDAVTALEALDELRRHAGTQFDPKVVEAMAGVETTLHYGRAEVSLGAINDESAA